MIIRIGDRAANGIGIVVKSGAALGCVGFLTCCKPAGERVEITETRELSRHAPPLRPAAGSAERFRTEAEPPAASQENPLTWTVPEGWTDGGHGSSHGGMRLIDLHFGADGEGECYLSAMPGSAGGLEANINRWRAQMGLAEYSADELANLPKRPFLNREASYVAFDGDFKPVGATESTKGYRLVGLIQPAPEFTLFVKMTGPKALVEKNEAAFQQFVDSISIKR